MHCPSCYRDVTTKKYAIFNCQCGKVLMLVEINKIKQVMDVTPNKEEKHGRVNGK